MLTAEANELEHQRERQRDWAIISLLMFKLDETEYEFGKFELDNAQPVLVTNDSAGNARVRPQS